MRNTHPKKTRNRVVRPPKSGASSACQPGTCTSTESHEQTIAELASCTEQLLSTNRALQDRDQELQAARAESRSRGEQLTIVDRQLVSRARQAHLFKNDLSNLLRTVDIPILIVDKEQRIRLFSTRAQSILNLLPHDVGSIFDDSRTNLSVSGLAEQVSQVIETDEAKDSEVRDQQGRWYRLQIRPYRNASDTLEGAILSLIDIHALKRHLAEVEDANRAKDEFLALLSHELRTPLTSMLLNVQRIRQGSMDAQKIERASAMIERGTLAQAHLVDDLLDVSRIVTGKLEMPLEIVDLANVVQTAYESFAPLAARKGVLLSVLHDVSLASIKGNSARLEQVVSNLLANAIKFSGQGGEIKVALRQEGAHVLLTISDNGCGIEPAFLPHVFRRFSQEDSSPTRAYGGLGLGLAISRHVVEMHGGTIRAESAGKNRGATFTVSFPVGRSGADARADTARPGGRDALETDVLTELPQLSALRVLLVEDDLATREVMADVLAATGADVRVVESAADGLAAVGDFRPAVVLCDIAMPGMDGYTFIRRLRALGRQGAIPALALTALAREEDRLRALAEGFQMHVTKPVGIDRLTQAVVDLSRATLPAGGRFS